MKTVLRVSKKEAYRHCRRVTHRGGPHFSVGFRFLPCPKRNAIYAIYAFCRYADDIADEGQLQSRDLLLKEWEKELYCCFRQEPTHPIGIALADTILRYPIQMDGFLGLLEGCRMDLCRNRYLTFPELMTYCDRVATTIRDLSLPVFGYREPWAKEYGRALSTALQLTNIVRDIGEDLNRGRIYIPLDEIKACGYSEEELLARTKNAAFLTLMEFQCNRIRRLFEASAPLVPLVDSDARLALSLMREVYIALLHQIEQQPFAVLEVPPRLSSFQRTRVVFKQFLAH